MKIKAFIQCRNDLQRLDFVLENFFKHNPEIPVFVANDAGEDPKKVVEKYENCSYYNFSDRTINYVEDKNTPDYLKGSFLGYKAIERIFNYAFENMDFTHLLFLETDVLTKNKIKIEPKYDVSGFFNLSALHVNEMAYRVYDLKNLGILEKTIKTGWGDFSFMHTGCGGTIYSKKFFLNSFGNLPKIKYVDEKFPFIGHIDLQMTILAMISNCSVGPWEEVSQRNTIFEFHREAALEHNVKLISSDNERKIILFGGQEKLFNSANEIMEF